MANLNITADQFTTSMQSIQNRYIRLELLNYQFQIVGSLEGVATSGGVTIDANSSVRRTANLTLAITGSSFNVEPSGQIWLDKYVRIYVGQTNLIGGDIVWTNNGIYIIDAPSYVYDAASNTLSLSLLDLMAKLTGIRDGYLPGVPVLIAAGENIRQAIIDTLALGGFTKYVVENAPSPGVVPNDLEFGQGATLYDLLEGLLNIYPGYEMYFDVDGVFYYREIPQGANEPVMIDDTLWNNIVTSEQISVDFQEVKNVIEVYGRTHDPAYFAVTTSRSGSTLTMNISGVTSYTTDIIYGFTLVNNTGITSPYIRINSLSSYPVRLLDGKTPAKIEAEQGEVYYCVQFKGSYWLWLGHLQAYGKAVDDNPQSPFYINGTVGQIWLPLYDNEYSNCITDELAQERAEYELWLHTNMNNTISLYCVPVTWIDVNILVSYTPQKETKPNLYIIKRINYGLAPTDQMEIEMIRYYPPSTN